MSKPVFIRACTVASACKNYVPVELKRFEDLGVLRPVSYSESKIHPYAMITVLSLTMALEPSDGHVLPLPEDMFAFFNVGKLFSKIDSDAYLQIKLDDKSKVLATTNTSPPGIFQ